MHVGFERLAGGAILLYGLGGGSFSQLQLIFTNLELNEWVECENLQLIISSAISVG